MPLIKEFRALVADALTQLGIVNSSRELGEAVDRIMMNLCIHPTWSPMRWAIYYSSHYLDRENGQQSR